MCVNPPDPLQANLFVKPEAISRRGPEGAEVNSRVILRERASVDVVVCRLWQLCT